MDDRAREKETAQSVMLIRKTNVPKCVDGYSGGTGKVQALSPF